MRASAVLAVSATPAAIEAGCGPGALPGPFISPGKFQDERSPAIASDSALPAPAPEVMAHRS